VRRFRKAFSALWHAAVISQETGDHEETARLDQKAANTQAGQPS
jgi:hypothetical protein